MFCIGCGKELGDGTKFCPYCGRRFGVEEPAVRTAPAPLTTITAASPAHDGVGVGEWFVTLLLLGIPVVNLILLLVWGFGGTTEPCKRNFCRAVLVFTLIGVVVWLISFFAGLTLFSRFPELRHAVTEILSS